MFDSKFRKVLSSRDYFAHVTIPETWASLEEFTDWWLEQKMPMMIPWNAAVTCSDDATALVMFRKPPYQVELYLVHPRQYVPRHSHPGVDVITMFLAGGKTSPTNEVSANSMGRAWGQIGHLVPSGEYHGGSTRPSDKEGFGLLAFQRWHDPSIMSTAAIQWKGNSAGPKQEALIRSSYPNALIQNGHADITGGTA